MSKPLKPIPEFSNESEERAFWEAPKNDSTEYVDWSKARLVTFPKLRPTTETISLRMPEDIFGIDGSLDSREPRQVGAPIRGLPVGEVEVAIVHVGCPGHERPHRGIEVAHCSEPLV